MELPILLTLSQAAAYLHITKVSKLKELALNNQIRFIEVERNILFTHQHLIEFITSKESKL